jgi:hypothetical protein
MTTKQISIDKLNEHLFEAIEMLKNNSDPQADKQEKMDVQTAKTIADLGRVVIDGYKVKANVIAMLNKGNNPKQSIDTGVASGILSNDVKQLSE